jgi:phosphate/sulfate permease
MKAFTSAIVGADVLAMAIFPLAVASGAAAWVILASLAGLPVSTTHALTGAIVGVALLAGGVASVSWGILLSGIAAPLALSPLVSAAIGFGTHAVARRISPACVCVREDISPGEVGADGTITGAFATRLVISTCTCASSGERVGDDAFGDRLSRRSLGAGGRILPAGMLHWGAAAALSFALVSAWIVTLPIAAAFAALAALALRAAP